MVVVLVSTTALQHDVLKGVKMKEIFQRRKFNSLQKKMLKHKTNTKEWHSAKVLLIQYCKRFKHITFIADSKNYRARMGTIILMEKFLKIKEVISKSLGKKESLFFV